VRRKTESRKWGGDREAWLFTPSLKKWGLATALAAEDCEAWHQVSEKSRIAKSV